MIKQPKKSRLCGQCCLGTILGITLEKAIRLVGHKQGTYPKELAKHFKCDTLKLTKGKPSEYALCKVHFKNLDGTHWVLYRGFMVYDPNIGDWVPFELWEDEMSHVVPRITSFIKILNE